MPLSMKTPSVVQERTLWCCMKIFWMLKLCSAVFLNIPSYCVIINCVFSPFYSAFFQHSCLSWGNLTLFQTPSHLYFPSPLWPPPYKESCINGQTLTLPSDLNPISHAGHLTHIAIWMSTIQTNFDLDLKSKVVSLNVNKHRNISGP